jgi:hypothetical protein
LSPRRAAGLIVDPLVQVGAAVADVAADAEAGGSGSEVAPVAQGGDRDAKQGGGFGDGEQVGVLVGQGCIRWMAAGSCLSLPKGTRGRVETRSSAEIG